MATSDINVTPKRKPLDGKSAFLFEKLLSAPKSAKANPILMTQDISYTRSRSTDTVTARNYSATTAGAKELSAEFEHFYIPPTADGSVPEDPAQADLEASFNNAEPMGVWRVFGGLDSALDTGEVDDDGSKLYIFPAKYFEVNVTDLSETDPAESVSTQSVTLSSIQGDWASSPNGEGITISEAELSDIEEAIAWHNVNEVGV